MGETLLQCLIGIDVQLGDEDRRDSLKRSGLGKSVNFYSKLDLESEGNRRLPRTSYSGGTSAEEEAAPPRPSGFRTLWSGQGVAGAHPGATAEREGPGDTLAVSHRDRRAAGQGAPADRG